MSRSIPMHSLSKIAGLRILPVALSVCLLAAVPVHAQTFETRGGAVKVETIADGLEHPWGMAELPDGSVLVTERDGRLWRVADGGKSIVDGVPQVAATGQGGLLDIEADENFEQSRRIYFTWSQPGEGGASTALSTATLSADNGKLEDVETLFAMELKTSSGFHFGSRVVLAPDDKLFVTTGDRGQPMRAQAMDDHAGAVIRLNRDGSVPPDNPYAGDGDALPELYSKGHRNPQGAAWDSARGVLWTVAHGARGGDEINRPQPGKNYGWPVISYGVHYSGAKIGVGQEAEGFEQPLWYWDPSIAPSGLDVYDGDMFAGWRGNLLVGALKYQMLVRLVVEDGEIVDEERLFTRKLGRIRDVAVFSDGSVYLLTDESDGRLLRVTPAG